MCETCNLMCGKCKPAALYRMLCPHCGKGLLIPREQCIDILGRPRSGRKKDAEPVDSTCKWCHEDLTQTLEELIKPEDCLYTGIVCGYPCGQHTQTRHEGERACRQPVPMGKLSYSFSQS